jgi:DNA topoisomerase-3
MQYIMTKPSRLYCETCEAVYPVPQGGSIKLYKELVCPLDAFELVLFSVGGADGRAYPLCPYCYSHPPFENVAKVTEQPLYCLTQSSLPVQIELKVVE